MSYYGQPPARPGDWVCQCGSNNYSFRDTCFRCNAPRPQGAGAGGGPPPAAGPLPGAAPGYGAPPGGPPPQAGPGYGAPPGGYGGPPGGYGQPYGGMPPYGGPPTGPPPGMPAGPPGSWTCGACYAPNPQFNDRCGQCRAPKPMDLPLFGRGYPPAQHFGGGPPNVPMKPGDWFCACSNHNFSWRASCNKCGKPKPESAGLPARTNVAAKPGDWICGDAGCANLNFASRSECNRCGKPRDESAQVIGEEEAASAAAAAAAGDAHARPGDWICGSCSSTNFAWRDKCHKCEAEKPADAKVVGGGAVRPHNNIVARAGDWVCEACSNVNFASRDQCNQCGKDKTAGATVLSAEEAAGYGGGGGGAGGYGGGYDASGYGGGGGGGYYDASGQYQAYDASGCPGYYDANGQYHYYGPYDSAPQQTAIIPARVQPGVTPKPGDWVCLSCANTNFQWREQCHKCGVQKAEDAPTVGPDGEVPGVPAPLRRGGGGAPGQGGAWREGDWICAHCSNNNFSWRESCNKCGKERSGGGGAMGGGGGGQNVPRREGDWDCPQCNNNNFGFRTSCHKCGAPRAEGGRARSRSRSPVRGDFRAM